MRVQVLALRGLSILALLPSLCTGLLLRAHPVSLPRTRAALCISPAILPRGRQQRCGALLAAAGEGSGDEGKTKEERREKYQALFKDLIWKASKLPAGSASKTAYLVKAKNAKVTSTLDPQPSTPSPEPHLRKAEDTEARCEDPLSRLTL
jgi:hypothetical protein